MQQSSPGCILPQNAEGKSTCGTHLGFGSPKTSRRSTRIALILILPGSRFAQIRMSRGEECDVYGCLEISGCA
jgi:hypothetical protein